MSYLEDLFSLKGETALITGGAGVIGSAVSLAFLQAGAKVMILSRTQASIDTALGQFKAAGFGSDHAKGTVADTETEAEVDQGLEACEKFLGPPTILVNGVGGNRGKTDFIDTEPQLFMEILKLNLLAGLVIPTKVAAARWMAQKIKGTIINVASLASFKPLSGVWAYDAAKAGVLNLTQATAKEFATHGIRVNAIAPGFFLGKQNRHLLVDEKTGDYTERGQSVIDRTPFKRFGEAGELSGAVLYLASRKASGFVTGITLTVDGGFMIDSI